MTRPIATVLLAALWLGTAPGGAMSPELSATVEAAIGRFDAPLAFATRLALLDARLAGEAAPTAADVAEAEAYAAAIVAPPRYARDVGGLTVALAALADPPPPEAIAALRAEIGRLQATAFQPGVDATLNRLRSLELLLQIASSLYGEAVASDGTPVSPDDVRFARCIVLVAGEIYGSIERDLDNRVQSVAAGMTNTLGMIDREVARDPAAGLARPDQIEGLIAFFLGYSVNF